VGSAVENGKKGGLIQEREPQEGKSKGGGRKADCGPTAKSKQKKVGRGTMEKKKRARQQGTLPHTKVRTACKKRSMKGGGDGEKKKTKGGGKPTKKSPAVANRCRVFRGPNLCTVSCGGPALTAGDKGGRGGSGNQNVANKRWGSTGSSRQKKKKF